MYLFCQNIEISEGECSELSGEYIVCNNSCIYK